MDWSRVQGNLPTRRYDIFVSYSRADTEIALGFQKLLESEGYRVWWDGELRAGDQFPAEIEEAIKSCRWVLCLWSKTATASDWVQREVRLARRAHCRMIPIKLDDCELPEEFSDLHTVNFTDYAACMKEIFRATFDRHEWNRIRHERSFLKQRYGDPREHAAQGVDWWADYVDGPMDQGKK